jgi:CBS-domain-containing membrane protein
MLRKIRPFLIIGFSCRHRALGLLHCGAPQIRRSYPAPEVKEVPMKTNQPLARLTAEEVMSRDVIAIRQDMPLATAARLFVDKHISGAPVIDEQERCVGVLSATDFVYWTGKKNKLEMMENRLDPCFCSDWQVIDPESLPRDAVCRHMSTNLVLAKPTTPLRDLARWMLDAHIHRIIVVDDLCRPIGIVSSTDVLAAVAYHGAEESEFDHGLAPVPLKG